MIEKLLDASIRFRWGVVILTLIISAYGLSELMKLPIDAVPDITNKQVQINTVEPNLGPLDIERLVTFPVETAMAGIPGLESSRSISRNGFSQVTVIFEDHTDLYFARQQVAGRLNQAVAALCERVVAVVTAWEQLIARIVTDGAARGSIRPDVDPQAVATLMIATIEGGMPVAAPAPGDGEIEAGELPGGLVIDPPAHPTRDVAIDTYLDHRMAMAFSLAGQVEIRDPACVGKTFPRYFEVLRQLGMLA